MCYKFNTRKRIVAIILYLITIGVLYIMTFYISKLFLFLNCEECNVEDSQFFVVIDFNKKWNLCDAQNVDYFEDLNKKRIDRRDVINSQYIGDEKFNTSDKHIIFDYRKNIYIYINDENRFIPLTINLTKYTYKEIHKIFGKGIHTSAQIKYLQKKFGKNEIELKEKTIFHIFWEQLRHPFYMYQIYAVIVWINQGYYPFCIILIILITIILMFNSYNTHFNYSKILKFSLSLQTTVIRKLVYII